MLILKKIKLKAVSYFFAFLIKFSLFINCPQLTAIVLAIAVGQVNNSGDFTVLCLSRSVFMDDVKAMAILSRRLKYLVIGRGHFQIIFNYFTDESERKQITENNYYTHTFCSQGKQKYYLYLNKLFPLWHKLVGFDAIFSGNFGYIEQQELAKVCQKRHLPFIVLHKEGLVINRSRQQWISLCKNYKFFGAKILLYSHEIMNALLGANITGLSRDKTEVVGMPRSDFYFTQKESINNKQVVFFSFYPSDIFFFLIDDRLINNKKKFRGAEEKVDDFHKWIMNFALNHKDIKVIIKTKAAEYYLQYVQKIFEDNFKKNINNLVMTNSANPFELIQDSIAVIGFNSSILIEAIMAGKIIISPYFGDFITDKPWDYFSEYPELVNYAKTEADLEEYILNSSQYINYDPKRKEDFLKRFISIPDGRASLRAEEAIIKTIKEFQK